jgi:ATP-binding protein involved in chromosome partitioning
LSLVQKVPIAFAVVITTPQNISLIDAKKAIDMFERTGVKIAGVVENMSYMLNPATGEKIQLFPQGELNSYLDVKKITKLVEIPFNPSVSLGSEAGVPIVESHSTGVEAQCFKDLAKKLISF